MSIAAVKKINQEIKVLAARAVREVLNDPDFGLELTAEAKKRLRGGNAF